MAERVKRGAAAKAKKVKGKRLKGEVVQFPKGASAASTGKGGRKKRGIGDNSGAAPAYQGVPDEVWKRHLDKIQGQHARMETAKAKFQSEQGLYREMLGKAEDDGLNKKAIIGAIKFDRQDHAKVVQDMADTAIALRVMGSDLAPGGQLDLFSNAIGKPQPMTDPALQGRNAGKAGEPETINPYTQGTEEFVVWQQNHRAGVSELKKNLTPRSDARN